MISQSEEIRSKVDALRLGVIAEESARQDLLEFLKKQGLLDTEARPMLEPDTRHDARTLHMCPWHTCANTKH